MILRLTAVDEMLRSALRGGSIDARQAFKLEENFMGAATVREWLPIKHPAGALNAGRGGHMDTEHDVFEGSWTAKPDRSDLDPNHRFQSAAMYWRRIKDGYELRAEGIGPDGKPCADAMTLVLDSAPQRTAPVAGATVKTTLADPFTLRVEAHREGQIIGQATYTVSEDGKSLTAESWGIDAEGRRFKTRVLFDRD